MRTVLLTFMACSQLEQRVQEGLARRRQEHEVILKSSKSVEQRRQQIVAWVKEHGQSQVEDLAVRFATSEVTIRKDLAALSQQGLLIRQFGGAVPVPSSTNSNAGPSQLITSDPFTNSTTSPAINAIGQLAAHGMPNLSRFKALWLNSWLVPIVLTLRL